METSELLFELSHSVRYGIIKALAEEPLKLTKLGELVGANNPEVSRHLDRLKKARLVEKDPDGLYFITSFGNMIMSILPYLSFVTSHPEFFLEHDLSQLPPEFMCRLGELESCEVIEGMIVNVYRLDEISKDSRSRIFTVSNEFVSEIKEEHFAEMDKALAGGLDFKYILQESQLEDKNLMKMAGHFDSTQDKHFRVVPKVPLFCSICDNEMMIAFLDKKGKVDFSVSFCSSDPEVVRWCEDLLNYLWDRGRLLSEFK